MHLWFKRARFNESCFGSPAYHRKRVAILAKITTNAVELLAIPRCDIRLIIDCLSDDFAFQSLALQLDDYDIPLGINSQKVFRPGLRRYLLAYLGDRNHRLLSIRSRPTSPGAP